MSPILQTPRLEPSELLALYGGESDYSCGLTDIEKEKEESGRRDGRDSVCQLRSVSEPDFGTAGKTGGKREVLFSNAAYYLKLEELKRTHLQNIAELERLYLNQLTLGKTEQPTEYEKRDVEDAASMHLECSQSATRPTKPNKISHQVLSLDEDFVVLDVGEYAKKQLEAELESRRRGSNTAHTKRSKQVSPTMPPSQRKGGSTLSAQAYRARKNSNAEGSSSRRNSKVTIPKPLQMMLREEEKKRLNVKTRSEMELENELLRKELAELRQCEKKFRARPVPAHTHLPLYEVISQRQNQHPSHSRRYSTKPYNEAPRDGKNCHVNHRASPKPFSFIERERKKREQKLEAELNNLMPKLEHSGFRARPVPKSLYRDNTRDLQLYGAIQLQTRAEQKEESSKQSQRSRQELEKTSETGEDIEINERRFTACNNSYWKPRGNGSVILSGTGPGRLEEEVMEVECRKARERDWSYIHPLRRGSQEVLSLSASKSDYISV